MGEAEESNMKQRNIILLVTVVFVAIVVIIIVLALIPKATLTFTIAPTEATVSINGKEQKIKNQQSITVAPGEQKIIISRDEFGSYEETVTVKNGQTHEVIGALDPQTDAAHRLMETPEAQEVLQRVTAKTIQVVTGNQAEKYPLMNELPIKDKFYSIVVCGSEKYPKDTSKIAICIKLYDLEAKQSALDDIESRGYKLEDYEIIILDSSYKTEGQD